MYSFEVYQDKGGDWRWRFLFNNTIMADSSEGYSTKSNAKRALRGLGLKMTFASIEEITE